MSSGTMKAWIFQEPESMQLEEREIPSPAADQLLIRVKACGVCGSDVAYYWGESSLETPDGKGPLVLGHEFSGEVAEVGDIPASKNLFQPGDRVTVNPVQYCNTCEVCHRGQVNLCENKGVLGVSADGAFAEYVLSHYQHVYRLPESVSYEAGAFTEPLACGTYAVKNLDISLGDTVVVLGPGAIGLSIVALAKASGAGRVILAGTRDYRLETGKTVGADVLMNTSDVSSQYYCADITQEINKQTRGKMAERVIVATGSTQAMHLALEISGRRSLIVYFGLPGDRDKVEVPALQSILWDKTIKFSWLAAFTWVEALEAIQSGLVNTSPLITHSFPLDQLMEALVVSREKRGNPLKVMVTM